MPRRKSGLCYTWVLEGKLSISQGERFTGAVRGSGVRARSQKGRTTLEHILKNDQRGCAYQRRRFLHLHWQMAAVSLAGRSCRLEQASACCFPICGRPSRWLSCGDRVGKEVNLARHGFARKAKFEFAGGDETTAAFVLQSTPELSTVSYRPRLTPIRHRWRKLTVSYESPTRGMRTCSSLSAATPASPALWTKASSIAITSCASRR